MENGKWKVEYPLKMKMTKDNMKAQKKRKITCVVDIWTRCCGTIWAGAGPPTPLAGPDNPEKKND